MRAFIDAIFDAIVAASLSDGEFATVTQDVQIYSLELYNELLAILDARESISNDRDRLRFYFLSRGVDVPESSNGKSNIYLGDVLD